MEKLTIEYIICGHIFLNQNPYNIELIEIWPVWEKMLGLPGGLAKELI